MTIAATLATVLDGIGLQARPYQEADRSINWAIEGLVSSHLRKKGVRPALRALLAKIQDQRLRVFFVVDRYSYDGEDHTGPRSASDQRICDFLLGLGYQSLGITEQGLGELLGIDARDPPQPDDTEGFINQLHCECHRVLREYGFTTIVGSDLRRGQEYRHPSKPVSVLVKALDDDLDIFCLKSDGTAYDDELDYTPLESDWIRAASDDLLEYLRRQLHVLIIVRPDTMQHKVISERF